MAGRVLSPDLYSTAPLTAPPVVAEHMSAAATHRELAAQWMAKGDALAGSNSGALVDAAQEQAHKMAVAHQNQADMHEQTAQYHQRAADLAGSMNSSLDRVEQRAQQQLSQAKVWDWPVIMSDARIQASGINTDFTSSLAARHSASMASMGPLRAAISGLTGAAGTAASGVSMMGNPVTHGSIPSTVDWRGPQPAPQPSPQPQPHSGASAPPNGSHAPAGGTNVPHTPIGAAPAAAVVPPPPAAPGQPQPGQQPAPGQPGSADNKADDDAGDDSDMGDDSGGMEEMIPQLLMGLASSAAMLPQMASQAGSQLAEQASQGLTQGISQLTQGLGDDVDEGETEELSPPSGLGSGGGTGGGIGGGAGGRSGGGAAGGGSPDHLSAPSAHDYGPGQAKPNAEQYAGTTSQTAATTGGAMPMGMMPMGGMGGGGGGSPTAAAESRTKKVVSPKRPNTDPISGEDAQPAITVKADDTDGTPTLLKTLTRISAS